MDIVGAGTHLARESGACIVACEERSAFVLAARVSLEGHGGVLSTGVLDDASVVMNARIGHVRAYRDAGRRARNDSRATTQPAGSDKNGPSWFFVSLSLGPRLLVEALRLEIVQGIVDHDVANERSQALVYGVDALGELLKVCVNLSCVIHFVFLPSFMYLWGTESVTVRPGTLCPAVNDSRH